MAGWKVVLAIAAMLGCLAIAYLPTSSHGAGIYPTAILGGSGGGPSDTPCEPSSVLVGYNYRSGSALNAIVGMCRRVADKGLLGQAYRMKMGFGGNGGSSRPQFTCHTGTAIVGLEVRTDHHNDVYAIGVWCAPAGWVKDANGNPVAAQISGLSLTDGGEEARSEDVFCNDGGVATGFIGRSGALVDALGLMCTDVYTRPPQPTGPAGNTGPVVKVKPVVITGKTKGQASPARPTTPRKPGLQVNNGNHEGGGRGDDGGTGAGGASAATDTTIYDQPEGNDVAYLSAGDPVTVVSCNGDNWCQISRPRKGWVWGEDLDR